MRESMFKGLWPAKRKPLEEAADQNLDCALERLAQAMRENNEVCEQLRRRQSSGTLKIVSIPPMGLEAE